MDRSENTLLNRLDQPLRFIGINKDEAFTLIAPLFGGLYMGWILSGFVAGISALTLFRWIKKHNEGAALIHAVYWYLPNTRRFLKLPTPSHIREYIG
jgi:conjugal transfer pilus assembly protein TraL